jgi:hypothetical protein
MSSESGRKQPTIRILHHMARSGGTIICRCLASMEGIVLLSEIHPLGARMFNPLDQADRWYGLLTPDDIKLASSGRLSFPDAIEIVERRCTEQGKLLVIRDWSHLDYTGIPFVKPSYRPLLVEALHSRFRLLNFSSVRHPLDQWLSLSRLAIIRERLSPSDFLKGAVLFARSSRKTGFVRYEDFTRQTDAVLQTICEELRLPFDGSYAGSWQNYTNITGDVEPDRASDEIAPLPRRELKAKEARSFTSIPAFRQVTRMLGYDR